MEIKYPEENFLEDYKQSLVYSNNPTKATLREIMVNLLDNTDDVGTDYTLFPVVSFIRSRIIEDDVPLNWILGEQLEEAKKKITFEIEIKDFFTEKAKLLRFSHFELLFMKQRIFWINETTIPLEKSLKEAHLRFIILNAINGAVEKIVLNPNGNVIKHNEIESVLIQFLGIENGTYNFIVKLATLDKDNEPVFSHRIPISISN